MNKNSNICYYIFIKKAQNNGQFGVVHVKGRCTISEYILNRPCTSDTPESHRWDILHVSQSCPPSFTRKASPLVLKSLSVAKAYNKTQQSAGGWQETLYPFTATACLAGQQCCWTAWNILTCKDSLASFLSRQNPLASRSCSGVAVFKTIAHRSNTGLTLGPCFTDCDLWSCYLWDAALFSTLKAMRLDHPHFLEIHLYAFFLSFSFFFSHSAHLHPTSACSFFFFSFFLPDNKQENHKPSSASCAFLPKAKMLKLSTQITCSCPHPQFSSDKTL